MTKKEKESAAKPAKENKSVEELILNYTGDKYTAIPLAAYWAKALRRKEEHRHLTSNEILDISLADVLGGHVDWKDVKKAMANGGLEAAALPAGEDKSKS